jgi:hypothetical protein
MRQYHPTIGNHGPNSIWLGEILSMDVEEIRIALETHGSILIEEHLDLGLMAECRSALEHAIDEEAAYHGSTDHRDYGMVQCCPMYGGVFVELLNIPELMEPMNHILGAGCIVYSYSSSSLPPRGGKNFASRIHVDCPRLIPNYPTNLGIVILVDDFTAANGATWYLPASHERLEPPDQSEFCDNSKRLIAGSGSVWYVNPRLWHSAGVNQTRKWRHSIGINMCRPYIKQRLDIPRLLKDQDLSRFSESSLQKLGFFSQPPTSLDDYYAPIEERTFRQPYE